MDKQKQIEEMYVDLMDNINVHIEGHYELAEDLVRLQYRKIPEGAVVMTETERITMCVEQWDKGYNQARKNTAEKIKRKAKEKAFFKDGGYYDKDRYLIDIADLDEILKEITEGEKEISNETV